MRFYEENNFYTTSFEAPPVYQEDIVLWTRTNNAGNETKLYVKDVDGNDIFSRVNFQNNTLYKDTLNLTPGCYKIELIDTDHDGLNFFANNDGTGFFQIRKPSGAPLEGFDSDFGDQVTHYFTVGYALSDGLESNFIKLNCHPNPATDYLNIELEGFVGKVTIEIFDAFGKKVITCDLVAKDKLASLRKKRPFVWDDAFFDRFATHVGEIVSALESGNFSYRDQDLFAHMKSKKKSACRVCHYKSICRYSERYAA